MPSLGIPKKLFFEEIHPDIQKVMDDALGVIKELGGTLKEEESKLLGFAHNFEQTTRIRKPPKL